MSRSDKLDLNQLLEQCDRNPPASPADYDAMIAAIGHTLPADFRSLLLFADGAVGAIGENGYINLESTKTIPEMNRGLQLAEFLPGLISFGSDGGGMGYAYDTTKVPMPIVSFPHDWMDPCQVRHVSDTFIGFLRKAFDFKPGDLP